LRSDALGLRILREKTGVKLLVLSREVNPVVAARCRKMDVPFLQGVMDKAKVLLETLKKEGIDPANVIYVGNDIIDLPCFPIVGCALAPANSYPLVLQQADIVLDKNGGQGAIRELCDLLIGHFEKSTT
jgi:YrbI family 3-deoxy-D-manno-octulosonate 8-phosphate phosphatase